MILILANCILGEILIRTWKFSWMYTMKLWILGKTLSKMQGCSKIWNSSKIQHWNCPKNYGLADLCQGLNPCKIFTGVYHNTMLYSWLDSVRTEQADSFWYAMTNRKFISIQLQLSHTALQCHKLVLFDLP